ncbi:MAG: hypothetical protein OEY49_16120 [Candidatus Heimdallarchaeota archaeon]|nr:hypothetical protein [Candidatus Heimdallarchaeota archaeon]
MNNWAISGWVGKYPQNMWITRRYSSFSKCHLSQSLFSKPLNGGLEMVKT